MPNGARFERDAPYDAIIDTLDRSLAGVVTIGIHNGADADGFLSQTYFTHADRSAKSRGQVL